MVDAAGDASSRQVSARTEASDAPGGAAPLEVSSLSQLEHLLKRPETVLGAVHVERMDRVVVVDHASNSVSRRDVMVSPAFIGIVDEIIVNACDVKNKEREAGAMSRGEKMKTLKVECDAATGRITVSNDGRVLPVVRRADGMWQPEIAFGVFNSSSAFDDTKTRFRGGRNGLGAKGTNAMSKEFSVHIVDRANGLVFDKTWRDNMFAQDEARVRPARACDKTEMRVSFLPDFTRFGMHHGIDRDALELIARRVVDCAGVLDGVRVYFNGLRVNANSFRQYCEICICVRTPFEADASAGADASAEAGADASAAAASAEADAAASAAAGAEADADAAGAIQRGGGGGVVARAETDMWEVAVAACAEGEGGHMCFVNGIWTRRGGTHLSAVVDQVVSRAKSDSKGGSVTSGFVLQHCRVFVRCLVGNPDFDSQRKEMLKTPLSALGAPTLRPAFLSACISKTVLGRVLEQRVAKSEQSALSAASDGNKSERARRHALLEIEKLQDAAHAGTSKWRDCVLILTEGDSAKTMAITGLSALPETERSFFGVFPLKGKVMNVRGESASTVAANKEIVSIVRILGLDLSRRGEDAGARMRYGSVMLMTDQDHDGAHIKGLLINAIHHLWPGLACRPDFFKEFLTPVAQVSRREQRMYFYSARQYDEWKRGDTSGWDVKFFKGLGTSTAAQAKAYFGNLGFHTRSIDLCDAEASRKCLDLAFCPKNASDRKRWIATLGSWESLGGDGPAAGGAGTGSRPLSDFVDKDLLPYADASVRRAVPSAMDGLKPSQRKVISCMVDGGGGGSGHKERKVADLVGIVSAEMRYHHGEKSLSDTISRMAQRFWCANNLPFLRDIGSFGSRITGGDDCSSPRYINTALCAYTPALFPPADSALLPRLSDDGQPVEPVFFVPIIPTVLANGAEGIGTGWSTFVPPHSIAAIVAETRRRLLRPDDPPVPVEPHVEGFLGRLWVEEKEDGESRKRTLRSRGVAVQEDDRHILITELPIRVWTEPFVASLRELVKTSAVRPTAAILRRAETALSGAGDGAKTAIIRPPHAVKGMDDAFTYQARAEGLGKSRTVVVERCPFLSDIECVPSESVVKIRVSLENPAALSESDIDRIFDLQNAFSLDNMHLFDPSGNIKRYRDASEIFDDFFPVRMALYERRLQRDVDECRKDADEHDARARFIRAVCDGSIRIANVSEDDAIADIVSHGLPPDRRPGAAPFSYLRSLHVSSFTIERASAFESKARAARQALDELLRKKPSDLWAADLDALDAAIDAEKEFDRIASAHAADPSAGRGSSFASAASTKPAAAKRRAPRAK